MEEIEIRNLRSLVNIQNISISPLTVLVGKNSSGKSTFLRTFPLLKQTVETPTAVPILWYGDYVDFGDFKESLSRTTSEKAIELGFEFKASNELIWSMGRRHGYYSNPFENDSNNESTTIKVKITFNEKYIQYLVISFGDQIIKVEFKEDNKVTQLSVNDSILNVKDLKWISTSTSLIPEIEFITKNEFILSSEAEYFEEKLIDILMKNTRSGTKRQTVAQVVRKISIGKREHVHKSFMSSEFPNHLKDYLIKLSLGSKEFCDINDYFIASFLDRIIYICNTFINNTARAVKYIKPVRAKADRYYRVQGLYIDDIDPSGHNIPMFLHNLSESQKEDFENWTKEFFNLVFSTTAKEGHVSLIMKDEDTKESYNLADTGYGFSQILPILVLLWQTSKRKKYNPTYRLNHYVNWFKVPYLIVIEQPELHLHPAFQAKLIDVFARIVTELNKDSNIFMKIIFETHSETMINRLGYLIAKNKLDSKNVNVLIFDKNEAQETTIKSVNYSEKGILQGWPIGFFAPEKL